MADDDWSGDGISFKVTTGAAGILAEPNEGSGAMPSTFLSPEKAARDIATIRAAVEQMEDGAEDSYLASYISWIADDLEDALRRLEKQRAPT